MMPGFAVWLTGLPCSGKTTLAEALHKELQGRGWSPEVLDGDILRRTLSPDLSYSPNDRRAHVKRVTALAQSYVESGSPAIVALISPYRAMREEAKEQIQPFVEVYVNCPLDVCEARDVKGQYRRARGGEIEAFTGISSPYEEPERPDVVVDTDIMSVSSCLGRILVFLEKNRIID